MPGIYSLGIIRDYSDDFTKSEYSFTARLHWDRTETDSEAYVSFLSNRI